MSKPQMRQFPERVFNMTTTPNEPAATPAEGSTVSSDDGIIDLDAVSADEAVSDIEDGTLNVEDPKTEEPAATPAEGEEELDEKGNKRPSGAQRAKAEKQRLLDQIAERDRELETLRASRAPEAPAAKAGEVDPKAPKEADFNGDYFAFITAKTAYEAGNAARQAVREEEAARETRVAHQRQEERDRVVRIEHTERVEAAKSVITDFDEAMEGMKGVNVRNDLLATIQRNPNSALLTYHFAKNKDALTAINKLPPLEMAAEIGRLGAELKLPEPKLVSKAPPPLSRQKGGSSPQTQEQLLASFLDKKYGKDRK